MLALVLLLTLFPTSTSQDVQLDAHQTRELYQPDKWYKKYDSYPEYCSIPQAMEGRSIPQLGDSSLVGETRIAHVTGVVRHGARTPWTAGEACWDGYWDDDSATSVWDCDLTSFMAPPAPNDLSATGQSNNVGLPGDGFFIFEKKYDALREGMKNLLNGTCQVGQLLMRGYDQELRNGRMLREAYVYQSNADEHDERMRLINVSMQGSSPWDPAQLWYRADDDQRTLLSGQIVLRGLFEEELMDLFDKTGAHPRITLHTADRPRDILDPNSKVCPRLNTIKAAALQSDEYQAWNSSVTSLRDFARTKLGATEPDRLLDCLMTTMCTDRDLPQSVRDYGQHGSKFDAISELDIRSYTLVMKYNNSEHSKLSMGPLWAEIMDNINPWIQQEGVSDEPPAPKFALFAGHDTSVMPLLASLGTDLWNDTDWAPYASMLLIEIHELIDDASSKEYYTSPFAFRLVFNGKILTHFVEGCPTDAELCDIVHFQNIVDPIATRDADCSAPPPDSTESDALDQVKTLVSSQEGFLLFLVVVLTSFSVGALVCFVLMTRRLRRTGAAALAVNTVETADDSVRGPQGDRFEGSSEPDLNGTMT